MANLITGIDWIDRGLTPRPEPSEPAEEQEEGKASDEKDQDGARDSVEEG